MNKKCKTLLEKYGWTHVIFSYGLLQMNMTVLADQQEPAYNSSIQILDVPLKTCQEQWMIGMDGKKKSEKSVQAVQLDDDEYLIQ